MSEEQTRRVENEELAEQIAGVSSLSRDTAFEALQAGGRARRAALRILEAEGKYAEINAKLAASKKKLAEAIPA
jgi:hypothetical protein